MAHATDTWREAERAEGAPEGLAEGWAPALGRLVADLAAAANEDELFARLAARLPEVFVAERVTLRLLDAAGVLREAGDGDAVSVRLVVDGDVIGTLDFGTVEKKPHGAAALQLLEQVTALVGSCLERLRLVSRLSDELVRERRQAASLRALNDTAEQLQGALSEAEVVEVVVRDLPRVVVADRIAYARLSPDGVDAMLSPVGDPPVAPERGSVPIAGTAVGRVFASGGVLLVDDLPGSQWEDTRVLAREGYGSAAFLPLPAGGRTVGVIIAAARAPQRYSPDLHVALSTFARLAGATLERAWEHARRERIEASLHQSRKLESLGVLAGGIAHDFNNLLQGVLGNASLALADLPAGSPARLPVRQIEAAAQHAAALTSQLLAYAGRRQLRTEAADVSGLVSELGELIRSTAGAGATVRIDVPDDPCVAIVDPAQVRQLVISLVANASEALGEGGGTVTVTVAEADETNTPRHDAVGRAVELSDGVVITVEDNGSGMPPEMIARVFEPFFTTKFAGRGLGLPWAMGVAHGHGGAIAIESEVGGGTRVAVLLPSGTSAAWREPESPSASGEGRKVVLVVDDNESVVALAARILDREGYDVLAATDGTAALELFSQHGPSLAAVVLDVTMPGMSGDELFLELVEHGLRVPVIVSSGFAEEDALEKFDAGAVAGFLQKPYRAQELVDILRSALGQRGW